MNKDISSRITLRVNLRIFMGTIRLGFFTTYTTGITLETSLSDNHIACIDRAFLQYESCNDDELYDNECDCNYMTDTGVDPFHFSKIQFFQNEIF